MNEGRSHILTYHSLDDSGSVISTPPALFREQMDWLVETQIPVVPLERIRENPGAVAITFDDGFRNFLEHAAPVLARNRFPATVFIVSGYCGNWNNWPSQPGNHGIPRLELMGWQELDEIAKAGISIGCHTASHPYLSRLQPRSLEEELGRSRAEIEQHIGREADTFAYPYGDSTPQVREAAGRHFRFACSTRMAFVDRASDLLNLPRLDTYYLRSRFWFRKLDKVAGRAYVAGRASLRNVKSRAAKFLQTD